ncbi:MAG TPA: sigma-54 dependent transcriptional regulator [Candidatus Binatia bacterium]|jgi:DNA-binding NtrC family response regulator
MSEKSTAGAQLLYAEDDAASGRLVQKIAETEGYNVKVVTSGQECLRLLQVEKPDLLLVDLHLPDTSGLDLLARARLRSPDTPVIVVTASNSVDNVIKALQGGAIDYITKPVDHQRLIVSLGHALKITRQQQDLTKLRAELKETYKLEHMIGSSAAMTELRALIRQVAPSDATVLISGESGTGKELVARALHYASPRVNRPFVDVNCAALTETLIESELFGHEKGAFTSAISRRRGKFEQADGGNLFLDEIGDMPLSTQAKMLRVLQERTFQRVGGEEKISVNLRVICATNRNLEESVQRGSFRMDLFYRINMFVIEVPPLRERLSDIPELAEHFLLAGNRCGKPMAQRISQAALSALCQHNWPGNVRELQNAIERAVTVCDDEEIDIGHLPASVLRHAPVVAQTNGGHSENQNMIDAVEQFERAMILSALEKAYWNKTQAAKQLGVTRRILAYKMQNLGIEKADREREL